MSQRFPNSIANIRAGELDFRLRWEEAFSVHGARWPRWGGRIVRASDRLALPLRKDIAHVVEHLREEQARLVASLRYTGLDFKTFLPLYLRHSLFPDFPLHAAYRYLHAEGTGDEGFQALTQRNRRAIAKYLSSLRAMERMARNEEKIATLLRQQEIIDSLHSETVPAEIQAIRIGNAAFLATPFEMLSETGMRLKARSPFPHTFLASISNGYLHYAPPAPYYPRGGYEVTECLLAPEWEAMFEAAMDRLLTRIAADPV